MLTGFPIYRKAQMSTPNIKSKAFEKLEKENIEQRNTIEDLSNQLLTMEEAYTEKLTKFAAHFEQTKEELIKLNEGKKGVSERSNKDTLLKILFDDYFKEA